MNTGSLYQLHDARHEYVSAVAYGVHFHLLAYYVLIYQHRLILVYLHRSLEVLPQLFFVGHYLHGSSSEDEARSYQNGIAYAGRSPDPVFDVGDGGALRLRNVQVFKYLLEAVSVFGSFYGPAVGSYDLDSPVHQRLGQIYGRLTA